MKQRNYALYEWLFEVKKFIKERLNYDPHIFIFVSGWSATWKTSRVAYNIRRFFCDNSLLLSMDNYYRWLEYVREHNITFDEPWAIDIDLLVEHLERLKQWEVVYIPDYDFKESKSISDAIRIEPAQIIIIEWLFTLDHRFDSVSDMNIFVETSPDGRLLRRMLRDTKRTWQSPKEIIEYFTQVVDVMHQKYIEPQKENADIIIENEFYSLLEVRTLDIESFKKEHNIPNLNTKIWS